MPRKKTPEEEIKRMLERMRNFHRDDIRDRSSFNVAFSKEMDLSEKELSSKQKAFRDSIFSAYRKDYPKDIERQRELREIPERPKREFRFVGRVRGQIVRAEKTTVKINEKSVVRFRDKKGRFVSAKKR